MVFSGLSEMAACRRGRGERVLHHRQDHSRHSCYVLWNAMSCCSLAFSFISLSRFRMNKYDFYAAATFLPPVGLNAGSSCLSASARCSCIPGKSAIASGGGGKPLSRRLGLCFVPRSDLYGCPLFCASSTWPFWG